jgi:hypothetical protein
MFSDNDLMAYRACLRGSIIQPADAGYDDARKVFNAMISKRPRLIARCADVADVIASVNYCWPCEAADTTAAASASATMAW